MQKQDDADNMQTEMKLNTENADSVRTETELNAENADIFRQSKVK